MNKYELRVRELEKSDLRTECPIMPEPSFFQAHLSAFVEDMSTLKGIENAQDCKDHIAISSQMELQDVKTIMEPVFSNYFWQIRYVSIKQV